MNGRHAHRWPSLAGALGGACVLAVVSALAACSKGAPGGGSDGAAPHALGAAGAASGAASAGGAGLLAVARAEDLRRAKDVPAEVRTSHEVAARRRSARALARIADAASVEPLTAHLADEDPETIAWAAYGLAHACKGREEAHVKMLAARAASLPASTSAPARGAAGAAGAARGAAELDPRTAITRGIGRCGGGALGEQVLLSLAKSGGPWLEPAVVGFGDLATRKKQLGADAMTVLLEVTTPPPSAADQKAPLDTAFYALSRAEAGEAFGKRVAVAARGALARPGDARLLAIKALGRVGTDLAKEALPDLVRVVGDAKGFTAAERAEAARALGNLGEPGQSAAAEALAHVTPDNKDPVAIQALMGPELSVLETLLASLGAEPPKKAQPSLVALSALTAPTEPAPPLARRLASLRCAAALGLARGAYDAEVLKKCDAETSEISQRARLTALLRRPLAGERRAPFRAFAKSEHLRIREMAVEAIGQHAELGETGAAILAEALASKKPGLVATAAEVISVHPERVMVLAESEKRAALDPKAPPPTANPAQEVSREVGKALAAALAEKWPEDRFETRIALMEAAAAVRLPQAKAALGTACNDANVVVRDRAQKALRTLGENIAACNAPDREAAVAPEVDNPLARPTKVVLTTDAGGDKGPLSIVLEPELSPVTAARIASLVRSGFYKGIVVHRVVPGFVVQFGDPDGDGYGGSGTSLRCETSPVPFAQLDVGMALAGRDTGSSQLFVTLSRTPHLDGEYTRVGRAEGDWASLTQGDTITDAKIVE